MSNPNGRFGVHGGQYVPETLMNAIIELEEAYNYYKANPDFQNELTQLLNDYAGRPSRLYYAEKMTKDLGGAKIYLKREDLNHTGAHKINNVLGQALLAKKMGKTRLIAETGAGQHGVATATAAALMGMECVVFMGKEDTIRQALNVYRMRLLGATVVPVNSGTARSRTPCPKPCASGRRASATRTTVSALSWGHTPSPPSYAIFSLSSQARSSSRCSKRKDVCPMPWSRASAAARTPSAAFTISSTILLCASSVLRPRAAASTRLRPPRPSRPAGSAYSTA